MKKNIVCVALFNIICTQVYAVQTPYAASEKISTRVKSYRGIQQAETTHEKKSNTTTKKPQSIEINCDYRISAGTQKIDNALIVNWAEYAVLHSFNFDFPSFNTQLKNLRECYSQNGWISFINALKDSGNFNSIKTQNLIVSSVLDGKIQLIDAQESQWKITVPIKAFYKNDKEVVTHFLNVYIIISWKNASKLGIVQMIATPRLAPLSQKAIEVREAMNSFSLSVTHQINSAENLQNLVTSFLASLFVAPRKFFSETARAPSHPELCLKLDHDFIRQLQHLVEEQKNQILAHENTIETQMTNVISETYKNLVEIAEIERRFEWTTNQLIAIKSDVFETKLPKLLSYFKEKGTGEFYSALSKFDKTKMLKTLSLQMQIERQKNKNPITQLLNVNLTLGRKMNGEFVVLKMKAMTPSSNRAGTLVSNANLLFNRTDSILKMQQNNRIQLVQNVEISQPSQIPNIAFNGPSKQPKGAEIINCDYKTPSEMTTIDEDLVIKWAEHATTQSFDFNSASVETQLQKLESCYTAKGWENFKSALDKSGNIEAIKSQNFIMSSKVNGQIKLIETRNNQWNIELPLQVVYQNKQVEVTQFMNVNLTMGHKLTGEFGIMRMIATLQDPINTNTVTHSQSPATQSNAQALQNMQQAIADLIDCDYKVPVEIKKINQDIVLAWAKHAVIKSFNFDSKSIDEQLKKLQSCYMEQGWNIFINALEKSGNIKAFKSKKLSATSQIDGIPQLIEARDNQWTLTLPLKINYQFESGNVIQLLKVDLTIGRKNTGELGIIQLNSKLRSS